RLVQLSKSYKSMKSYTAVVIIGTQFGTYLSFTALTWNYPLVILSVWGAFHGVFVGMIAAALTEVLNVFPVIAKRIGLYKYVLFLMMALVFGKIVGSLFQWTIFVK